MKNKRTNRTILILLMLVFAVGVAIMWWVANSTDKHMRSELLVQAKIAAQAINIEHIASLSASEKDLNTPAYQRIKSQMASMRKARQKCRFLYLMGRRSDGKVFFFADSLPVDSKDYAPPGLIYEEVSDTYLWSFETKQEAVVGPVTDRWGTLVTALIPLADLRTGNLVAVLGMDVDANEWNKEILGRCSFPFAAMLLLAFLILLLASREQAVKALQESEEKHRLFFEKSPFGIIHYNNQGIISDVNEAMITIFGSSREKLIGLDIDDIPNKVFVTEVYKSLEGQFGYYEGEYTSYTGGKSSIIKANWIPIFRDGIVISGVGIVEDITKRMQAEEALRNSERFLTEMGSIAKIGGWEHDLVTRDAYWTHETYKIVEVESGSIPGPDEHLSYYPLKDRKKLEKAYSLSVETGEQFDLELQATTAKGRSIWVRVVGRPEYRDGNCVWMKGIIQNITKQKKMEGQLHQAQKLESIGNLAGGIAHDFNNILSSVIGFTELALDDVEKGTHIEDNLQEIYAAGKRAKDLVKQILAFARQSDEERKPIQVDLIIKEVLQFIRSSIPTTIEIRQNIESESLIMGSSTQTHQILMNLCTNAAYAMENEGGTLEVNLKDITVDRSANWELLGLKIGDYIEIKVSDTGTGIQPEILNKIFDPYFTTKGPGEGTGMGLAMVQGIIESYGGKITFESELGKGTKFTICLPIAKKRSGQDAYVPEQLPTGTERILFVDDEAPIAKMGGQILERLGYSVTTRTSSIEALELFQGRPNDFDLVVTDMTMPNLAGDKLAVELMKIRPDIPVILCTGYSKKISDEIASELGIKAFAYKPVVKVDLAKTVRKVLDEAKG